MIGYYRYEGYPLEQKIGWIRDGTGPSALGGAQEALVGLTAALTESEERLHRLVRKLGGSWKGSAAENAGTSVRKALTWSADSGQVTGDAKTSVDLQAERVALTRNLTPGCAPGSPEYGLDDALADSFNAMTGGLFDVQTNFDEQAARRRALEEEVDRVLYAHEAASRANLAAVPALAEVPQVTAHSVPPATNCLPVGPVRPSDEQPPSIGEREQENNAEKRAKDSAEKQADARRPDQKATGDDGKPGQVEPEPERTTAATHTASAQEIKQPAAEPPHQQQNTTRPSTVHTGPPGPVTRLEPPRPEPGRATTGLSPLASPAGRYGGGAGVGAGAGRAGAGAGAGVVSAAGRAPDQTRTPGGSTAVRPTGPAPHSPARAGAPGQARPGLMGGGFGPQGLAQQEEDAEHSDRYYARTDDIFGLSDLTAVAPVLGGEPA